MTYFTPDHGVGADDKQIMLRGKVKAKMCFSGKNSPHKNSTFLECKEQDRKPGSTRVTGKET